MKKKSVKRSIKKRRTISKKRYKKLLSKKRLTKKEKKQLDNSLFVNYCKCVKKIKYSRKYSKGSEYPICISSVYKRRKLKTPRNIIKRCKKYK